MPLFKPKRPPAVHRWPVLVERVEPRVVLSTWVVTTVADSGIGSLRQALLNANASPGPDVIAFNIPGAANQSIAPLTDLPRVSGPVTIDATTQPGYAGRPLIELTGAAEQPNAFVGLVFGHGSDGSSVRGLVVNDWATCIEVDSANCLVAGNYIGTDASGTTARAVATQNGVWTFGWGDTVGGTAAADRNVISGNAIGIMAGAGTFVQGNYIGTDYTGSLAVPNQAGIETFAGLLTIGGRTTGAGNLISGNIMGIKQANSLDPIGLVTIQGNLIGTDASGMHALGNGTGISLSASGSIIGGADAAARNVISGNQRDGAEVQTPFPPAATSQSPAVIEGNYVGVALDGTTPLGNGRDGIELLGQAAAAQNVVENNGRFGIVGGFNTVTDNVLSANRSGGIGLIDMNGNPIPTRNAAQAPPVLSTVVAGTNGTVITATAPVTSRLLVDFFASPTLDAAGLAEGQVYLGRRVVDTSASFRFHTDRVVPSGWYVTGTATNDAAGATSPFSAAVRCTASAPPAQTFLVTNTNDSGAGSLQQALLDANQAGTLSDIRFQIPGSGVHTIAPLTLLPRITAPVRIEGTSQPGYSGTPLIELDGEHFASGGVGLEFAADGNTVSGLVINRWPTGIRFLGSDNLVTANYIGTDATGALPISGNQTGVTGLFGQDNLIGGVDPASRNVISGNAVGIRCEANTIVEGNLIGTDPTGAAAVANGIGVSVVGNQVTVGAPSPEAANVISGNTTGIDLGNTDGAFDALVQGNKIGTDLSGALPLGNQTGIAASAAFFLVGGVEPGAGNIISGNVQNGVSFIPRPSAGSFDTLEGNWIGTNPAMARLGNGGDGVSIDDLPGNSIGAVTPGAGNIIANNGGIGVDVKGSNGIADSILSNEIFANHGPGIDLLGDGPTANDPNDVDSGPNGLQNYPVLLDAHASDDVVTITDTLNSPNAGTLTEQYFANISGPAYQGPSQVLLRSLSGSGVFTNPGVFQVTWSPPPGTQITITATATDSAGNTSEFSPAVPLTYTPPAVGGKQFNYQHLPQSLAVYFTRNVSASLDAGDLVAQNLTTGQAIPAASVQYDHALNGATFTFGSPLPDGNYRFTIRSGVITNSHGVALDGDGDLIPGGDWAYSDYVLTGDVNRDRSVDFNDLLLLAQSYGRTSAAYAQGDVNGDGKVDFTDLLLLAQHYGHSVPALVAAAPTLDPTPPVRALSADPGAGLRNFTRRGNTGTPVRIDSSQAEFTAGTSAPECIDEPGARAIRLRRPRGKWAQLALWV